jgi:hypothetical protein
MLETPEAEIDIKALNLMLSLTTIYKGIILRRRLDKLEDRSDLKI